MTEPVEAAPSPEPSPGRSRRRRVAGRVVTVAALLFLLVILLAPNQFSQLTPAAFLRIPIDALVALALVLSLPVRAQRITALIAGAVIGVLGVTKLVSIGFSAMLGRPFDPMTDWPFLRAGVDFVRLSFGSAGATGLVIAAVLAALAVLVAVTLSFMRLTRLALTRRMASQRTVVALALAWTVFAVSGVHIIAGVPVASHDAFDQALQVRAGLQDRKDFAQTSTVDAFGNSTNGDMLGGLYGKDVVLVFVESYGRVASDDPEIGARLDAAGTRLRDKGFGTRSGFLTSPTATGGSWLAHATTLSGLWVNNQQRYHDLFSSDRLTLNKAFQRAGWRTVGVMPGNVSDWPEGGFYGYDRIYAAADLGYGGEKFSFSSIPDQYALSAFRRLAPLGGWPVMATVVLTSSHAPWDPVPKLVAWDAIGNGSGFQTTVEEKDLAADVLKRDPARVRADYRRAIEYSLESLISYVETYGDDDLVLVFLGDHQPAPIITGPDAGREVPITVVTRDRAVMQRTAGWGWQEGLRPGNSAPIWRMDEFRDRFLAAFR